MTDPHASATQKALDQASGKTIQDIFDRASGKTLMESMGSRSVLGVSDVVVSGLGRSVAASLMESMGSRSVLGVSDVVASGLGRSVKSVGLTHPARDAAEMLRKAANSHDAVAQSIDSPWSSGIFREFEGARFDALVESIRNDQDQDGLADLEWQFARQSQSKELLQRTAVELKLTVPFDHDPAVRAALQFVVAVVYSIIMISLVLYYPMVGAVTAVTGTATSKMTWTYVGGVYDKLYNKEHYHPEKDVDSAPRAKGRRPKRDKGVW